MMRVQKGHFVKVNYTGTLDNGAVFDSTESCHPMEVEVGSGNVLRGFEDALIGMARNEKKVFSLAPEDAYGQRDESLEQSFDRSEVPPDFQPAIGEVVGLQTERGDQVLATVKHVDSEKITVDLNHPLAGQSLTFEVEVNEINDHPSPTPSCGCGCSCS
jgi:peptidylprolyl isomerase